MRGLHGIAGVTGGTLPAEIWHAYMASALEGQPVEQFAAAAAPAYKRWCGRYEFARTWRDARKHDGCSHRHKQKKPSTTTTKRKTTTAKTTTAVHTTTRITTSTLPATTTKTKPPPPPPTTTAPTTTTTTTTTTTSGPP